ncbi:hypothetical protein [Caldibacillus debilis]|uniref:hypothetical protein n=1 Tax=Caldibacillus debilis TaxID=301148 RepID=UPI00160177BD|nr:hypothetical protein [Caldibacillus debilis]
MSTVLDFLVFFSSARKLRGMPKNQGFQFFQAMKRMEGVEGREGGFSIKGVSVFYIAVVFRVLFVTDEVFLKGETEKVGFHTCGFDGNEDFGFSERLSGIPGKKAIDKRKVSGTKGFDADRKADGGQVRHRIADGITDGWISETNTEKSFQSEFAERTRHPAFLFLTSIPLVNFFLLFFQDDFFREGFRFCQHVLSDRDLD